MGIERPKGYYFAFDGTVFTSSGTPHPTTGNYNCLGQLYGFSSKADRDAFCDKYSNIYNNYPKACTANTARQYHLGMSVVAYTEELWHAIDLGTEL